MFEGLFYLCIALSTVFDELTSIEQLGTQIHHLSFTQISLLVCWFASQAVATKQGLRYYTKTQLIVKPLGLLQKDEDTALHLYMGTGAGEHESMCRCVHGCVYLYGFVLFVFPILAMYLFLVWRLKQS